MGTYTSVAIVAPAEALAGQVVEIQARVQNLAGYDIYISPSAKFDNTLLYLNPDYAIVGAGQVYSFSGSFTMPNKVVRIYVWSYYWDGEEWRWDDEAYVDIALKEMVPEFKGFALTEYNKR